MSKQTFFKEMLVAVKNGTLQLESDLVLQAFANNSKPSMLKDFLKVQADVSLQPSFERENITFSQIGDSLHVASQGFITAIGHENMSNLAFATLKQKENSIGMGY